MQTNITLGKEETIDAFFGNATILKTRGRILSIETNVGWESQAKISHVSSSTYVKYFVRASVCLLS